VYFVCIINTDFRKFDRYKHVQSEIAGNVLLLCLRLLRGTVATERKCGRKFLHQLLWHIVVKVCTKNYENLSIFVKVTAKKFSGPLLCGRGVVIIV